MNGPGSPTGLSDLPIRPKSKPLPAEAKTTAPSYLSPVVLGPFPPFLCHLDAYWSPTGSTLVSSKKGVFEPAGSGAAISKSQTRFDSIFVTVGNTGSKDHDCVVTGASFILE